MDYGGAVRGLLSANSFFADKSCLMKVLFEAVIQKSYLTEELFEDAVRLSRIGEEK